MACKSRHLKCQIMAFNCYEMDPWIPSPGLFALVFNQVVIGSKNSRLFPIFLFKSYNVIYFGRQITLIQDGIDLVWVSKLRDLNTDDLQEWWRSPALPAKLQDCSSWVAAQSIFQTGPERIKEKCCINLANAIWSCSEHQNESAKSVKKIIPKLNIFCKSI